LAGESSTHDINSFEFGSGKLSDVAISFYAKPVLRQNVLAEWINLYLPAALHPGPFQSEIHAANASEQRAEGYGYCALVSSTHIVSLPASWDHPHIEPVFNHHHGSIALLIEANQRFHQYSLGLPPLYPRELPREFALALGALKGGSHLPANVRHGLCVLLFLALQLFVLAAGCRAL
jgi:hypothetical protein